MPDEVKPQALKAHSCKEKTMHEGDWKPKEKTHAGLHIGANSEKIQQFRKKVKGKNTSRYVWPGLKMCARGDSNSHALASTTPSRWRVYLFHHVR